MAGNTQPIFPAVWKSSYAQIPTANALIKSDGSSTAVGNDIMINLCQIGANGSFVDRIRFYSVANTPTTGNPTVLRVFTSTVAAPGATTSANTHLIGEISAGAIPSSNATNAVSPFDVLLGYALESGQYIHVAQHVAQTANQMWVAHAIYGNY